MKKIISLFLILSYSPFIFSAKKPEAQEADDALWISQNLYALPAPSKLKDHLIDRGFGYFANNSRICDSAAGRTLSALGVRLCVASAVEDMRARGKLANPASRDLLGVTIGYQYGDGKDGEREVEIAKTIVAVAAKQSSADVLASAVMPCRNPRICHEHFNQAH